MKKYIVLIISVIFALKLNASELQVYYYYSTFKSPTNPYIETYLSIIGNTTKFVKNENGKFNSTIEISIIFKQNGKVVKFRKHRLNSPELNDTIINFPNFIDQQRIFLDNGIYNFELIVRDINSDAKEFKFVDVISINYQEDEISFSGTQFVESYKTTDKENILSKSGYDLVPYIADFYPENMEELIFYTEIYNVDKIIPKDELFLIRYYTESSSDKDISKSINGFQKQKASNVNVILPKLNIDKLWSGNYYLVIEVIDKENKILARKKTFFQRSRPPRLNKDKINEIDIEFTFVSKIESKDTMLRFLDYLFPIADIRERQFLTNQLEAQDLEFMKRYFYSFWYNRSSTNPEGEWNIYKKQIKIVNNSYSTQIVRGYKTDRGRVYLQYGTPDDMLVAKDGSNHYPYEMWQYYSYESQRNIKFVFYNPTYQLNWLELLHSTAKGEPYVIHFERYIADKYYMAKEHSNNSDNYSLDSPSNKVLNDYKKLR